MKRKDLRNEAKHLPASLDDLVQLREAVMAIGESRRTADGLCMWLVAKANGETDTVASNIRSKYRKILLELDELQPVGPGGGDGGYVRSTSDALGIAIQAAVGGAVLALTKNVPMALVAAAAGNPRPVSYVNPTEGELVQVDFSQPQLAEVA